MLFNVKNKTHVHFNNNNNNTLNNNCCMENPNSSNAMAHFPIYFYLLFCFAIFIAVKFLGKEFFVLAFLLYFPFVQVPK